MKIYVIRHGETDWNTKRLLQGQVDIPLNQNGLSVARITAQGLRDVPFAAAFTSPLIRARRTAEIIAEGRNIPIFDDDRLKEIGFGEFEGYCCSSEGYNIPDPRFIDFFHNPAEFRAPEGGEPLDDLCSRTTDFIQELANNQTYADQTVLVSTHGTAIKGLLSSFTISDLSEFWGKGVHKNCGVTILDVSEGKITLMEENVIYYDESLSTNYF